MNRLGRCALTVVAGLAVMVCGLWAAEAGRKPDPAKVSHITPEKAGRDFQVQGEYEGMGAGIKAGVQVIALGKDEFRAVFHAGGLPGAGWDGKDKEEVSGKWEGDKVIFRRTDAPTFNLTIPATGDKASGTTQRGEAFTLTKVVRQSPTMGATPPEGAKVLFDGKGVDAWQSGAKMDERGLLMVGVKTKEKFTDFTLHAEFILPFMPLARGQARGNSGVYLQDRYEIQVLDSFALKGEDNECGGLYKNAGPKVNMCFPPLSWQTFDIDFTAAKFDAAGKKTANAVVTVKHNGVVIHDKQEIKDKTGGGQREAPTPGAIQLQDHRDPVFYRNVWVVEKK